MTKDVSYLLMEAFRHLSQEGDRWRPLFVAPHMTREDLLDEIREVLRKDMEREWSLIASKTGRPR